MSNNASFTPPSLVLSSRLGGEKDALLLIANPLELNFLQRDWRCACYRRS